MKILKMVNATEPEVIRSDVDADVMTDMQKKLCDIATAVYQDLGSGHDEQVYHRAMEVELRERGINYESERRLELFYKKQYVGENFTDLIVRSGDGAVVVELKAKGTAGPAEQQQVRKYMKLLGIRQGLLLNFPQYQKADGPIKTDITPIALRDAD